ncbi:hypothetical protein JCM10450v2_002016 [Rhodotorula kratochvilovae]
MSAMKSRRRPHAPAARKAPPAPSWRAHRAYADALAAGMAAFFSSFGAFLASHQTLSLMCTGLLICSLLSPAIILTFSPSGSIFDLSASAITRRGRGELVWELDGLRRQGLISTEEDVCWDRVRTYYDKTGREGGGRRIRVEQVLVAVVGAGATAHRGTISKGVLHRTLRVQREIERRLLAGQVAGNACLRVGADGQERCAVLSPAEWWGGEDDLLRDADVHRTLSAPARARSPAREPASSLLSLPLTLSETFVGIGRDRQGTVKSAQHLVVTFFLDDGPFPHPASLPPASNSTRVEDATREAATQAWRQAVHEVVEHKSWLAPVSSDPMGITTASKGPVRHVLVKYLPQLVGATHSRRLENGIYGIGYLLVTLYVWRYIRKLRAHSKMGLLVTGIVELAASGIMSVSICWLMGWDLGLVPWNLLAFLVLTSGLDNMILVLRAIASTDVNLPVPQRMSVGLRTVGVEMTVLLAVEELMALGLLCWVEIDVMREWIRFGAVVLVVDYFLELTFFSTVLSIDIQRLELADLLVPAPAARYEPVTTTAAASKTDAAVCAAQFSFGQSASSAWKVLRQRPAKTATVAFLWFINVILWASYGSEHYLPAACSHTALSSDRPFLAPSISPAISGSHRFGRSADPASASSLDIPAGAAASFWHLINPSNATSVQVYLEPPVSIQFFTEDALAAPESLDLLSHGVHDAPSLATKAALVVLPIAVVMSLLYALLLYLLKDAELLQAHWGSEERLGGPERRRRAAQHAQRGPEAGVERLGAHGARHTGDVELVASGGDAVVSWAGLEGALQVRRGGREVAPATFVLDVATQGGEPVSLVALAVDPHGRFAAATTASGRVLAWSLERAGAPIDFDAASAARSPVVALLAESETSSVSPARTPDELALGTPAPPTSSISRARTPEPPAAAGFYSLHRDGRVVRWHCGAGAASVVAAVPAADNAPIKRWLVPVAAAETGSNAPLLALALPGGRLQLVSLAGATAGRVLFDQVVAAGGAAVTALAVGSFPLLVGDAVQTQQVVAVGTSSGSSAFYTLSSPATRLGDPAELGSPIRQIRLTDAPTEQTCSTCGDLLADGFIALVSTRSTLRVLRIFTPPTPAALEPCACNTADALIVARSRSSSMGTGLGSPTMSRTLSAGLSSALNASSAARRFSPRKKPATPTRPNALGLGESPLRPRMPPTIASGGSGSSSGSGSPVHERSAPPWAPLAQLATPPPPPPLASPQNAAAPLPDVAADPLGALNPPFAATASEGEVLPLRVAEVASALLDERSGWDILTCASSSTGASVKAIGLRRRRAVESEAGGRGWEVWSLALGRARTAFDEGYERGASELDTVLTAGEGDKPPTPTEAAPLANGLAVADKSPASSLRRRFPPASPLKRAATTWTPSIRFSPSAAGAADLPFSRARPVVPALGESALAVGLGNQLVVLKAVEADGPAGAGGRSAQQNGFLGWS